MSCGNHHETDCSEVIARVYEFIDGEMAGTADCAKIEQHLDECGPCLREYGLEEAVKALVRRSCREPAPAALRSRVLLQISTVHVQITRTD